MDKLFAFTCQYASYSPNWKSDFGTMACWAEEYKEEFKNETFIDELGQDEEYGTFNGSYPRQETYLCIEYRKRKRDYIPYIP